MIVTAEIERLREACDAAPPRADGRQVILDPRTVIALLDEVERLRAIDVSNVGDMVTLSDTNADLRAEVSRLRKRPPMACTPCEEFNLKLADENDRVEAENAELREVISEDKAILLESRNELECQMHEVVDALMFVVDDKPDLFIKKDAGAKIDVLVKKLRSAEASVREADVAIERMRTVYEAAKVWRLLTMQDTPIDDTFADVVDAALAKEKESRESSSAPGGRGSLEAFVEERLASMRARPLMWATTKESFGSQLLLLCDVALYPQSASVAGLPPVSELTQLLLGPGSAGPTDAIDDAWAVERVDLARGFISKKWSGAVTPLR